MKSTTPVVLLACSLVLDRPLYRGVPRRGAVSRENAVLKPEGVTPDPPPRVTAQQVEDGSATLQDFAGGRERPV